MPTYRFDFEQVHLEDASVIVELSASIVILRHCLQAFAAELAQAGVLSHFIVVSIKKHVQKNSAFRCGA